MRCQRFPLLLQGARGECAGPVTRSSTRENVKRKFGTAGGREQAIIGA